MALTRDQKTAQVRDLTQKLKDAESVMFAHYIGLTVADVSELRKKLRQGSAEMKVAKKTLIALAAKEAGLPAINPNNLDGPVSCIFSFGDAMTGAQIAFKFGKSHKQVELIGGIFEGKLLSREEVVELAKMPSRDHLLAIFATMLNAPITQFAAMCNNPLGGFARVLDQLASRAPHAPESSTPAEASPTAPKPE